MCAIVRTAVGPNVFADETSRKRTARTRRDDDDDDEEDRSRHAVSDHEHARP